MSDSIADLLEIMKPKPCPFPLMRIGGKRDGAYLVPQDLEGIQACYSPGVSNSKTFEDELVLKHGIPCHLCDFSVTEATMGSPLIQGMQTFNKLWLDTHTSTDSITLEDWTDKYTPDPTKDLLLQIDIEGAEYSVIPECPSRILDRFRIVVIEVHDLNNLEDENLRAKRVAPLLKALDRSHVCVHVHPNNCCGQFVEQESGMNIPIGLEMTFLRKDRFDSRESRNRLPSLPHPLDITSSIGLAAAPIHLNGAWVNGRRRSLPASAKVFFDLHVFPISSRINRGIERSLRALPLGAQVLRSLQRR